MGGGGKVSKNDHRTTYHLPKGIQTKIRQKGE